MYNRVPTRSYVAKTDLTPVTPFRQLNMNTKHSKSDVTREELAISEKVGGWAGFNEDAKQATNREHELGMMEAFKRHKKAVAWSMAISLGIVMEGYDLSLIGSFYAYPSFQKRKPVMYWS